MLETPVLRLAGRSALYGLAGAIGKALALLTVPILSRALEPTGYGLADLATSLAAILTIIVMFAGDIPTARIASALPADRRSSVYRAYLEATIGCSLVAIALAAPLAGLIASGLWGSPGQTPLALAAMLLVPISAAQAALLTLQRLEGRAPLYALLATIDLLAQLLFAVVLVLIGLGPMGVVLGFVAGSVVGLTAAAIPALRYLGGRRDGRLALRLVGEGAAFLPATIFFVAADYATRYFVLNASGESGVGYFAVAIRLASVMSLAAGAFALAWGPYGLALNPGAVTARIFGSALTAFSALSCVAALGLATLAPELVAGISGQAYASAAAMLPGLLVAAATAGASYIVIIAAGVSQQGWIVALSSAVAAVAQTGLTAGLLPVIGLGAVGIGAMAARLLQILLLTLVVGPSAIRIQGLALSLLAFTALGAGVLQFANGAPDETRIARIVLAGACLVVGLIVSARTVHSAGRPIAADGSG